MARPLRIEYDGALYHLIARGNRRQAIFERDSDSQRFLDLLAQSLARFDVDLHAFVLMGNHFHLLAQTRRANLSRWMHWLLSTYAIEFQRRHRRVGHGHLFQGRFKSHLVETESYLLELSRYLHLNPVRGAARARETVSTRRERLRAYIWSSYPGYGGLRAQWKWVTEDLVLGEMARSLPRRSPVAKCRREYGRFIERGLIEPLTDPREELVAQTILGSEGFVQEVVDRLNAQSDGRRESTAERQLRPKGSARGRWMEPGRIIACVEAAYARTKETWGTEKERGKWSEERGVAMALLRGLSDLSYREIGQMFGGVEYAAVAQRVRRTLMRDAQGLLYHSLANLEKKCQNV
ncbi:MAG: transposase [Chthoniobacterales bacterium]|nr:transposase [Chthoniobacterales bacterium]